MRKICLVNQFADSTASLSIFSKLAQKGKRVLIIDLRLKKTTVKNDAVNAYHFLNELENPEKFFKQPEPNLHIIEGHPNLNFQEFNLFFELFKFDYFEKKFKDLKYDYIIFECSSELSLMTLNSLFYVDELIAVLDCDNRGHDFACKLSRFNYHFNKLYGMNMFISKIVPVFKNKLDNEIYNFLTSEFTAPMITSPLVLKGKNVKDLFGDVAFSIMVDEKKFDSEIADAEKQRSINEYLEILTETAKIETPLTKFMKD